MNLRINEVLEEIKDVILAPNAVKAIVFTVTRDEPGTYSIEVNGLTGSFSVKPVPPPAPAPTPPAKPFPWPLVGGIIGGGIVLSLVVYLLVIRRRGKIVD